MLLPKYSQLYFGLSIPFVLAILIGNGLVIAIFIREREVRTTTNIFLTSIAISDFIFGFGYCFWMSKLFPHKLLFNKYYCLLNWILAFPMEQLSMWHVLVIGIDRTIEFSFPFRHHKIATTRNVTISIVVMWIGCTVEHLIATFAGSIWFPGSNCHYKVLAPLVFKILAFFRFFLVVAIVVTNGFLLAVLIKIAKRVDSDALMMRQVEDRTINESDYSTRRSQHQKHVLQKKVTQFVFIVNSVFIVCHLPKCILLFLVSVKPMKVYDLLYIINFGGLINSAINPWIYALRDITFNAGFRKLKNCIRHSRKIDEQI